MSQGLVVLEAGKLPLGRMKNRRFFTNTDEGLKGYVG